MSKRDDQGSQPPADDRTLLDPLSSEELEALRRARQRLRDQGGRGEPTSQPMVVGPDDDPTLGDAPTRATPALPKFEGRVSLDQIRSSGSHPAAVRDPAEPGAAPSQPMSVYGSHADAGGDEPTLMPGSTPGLVADTRATVPGRGPRPGGPTSSPQAGPTGFGENTLMWMQPPKAIPAPTMTDVAPPPASLGKRLRSIGMVGILLAVVVAVIATTMLGNETGTIELRTDPAGATVVIDGTEQTKRTPVQVTMGIGPHAIQLSKDGYLPLQLEVNVDAEKVNTQSLTLEPRSAAGLSTVTVQVQPIAARIKVDEKVEESTRTMMVANLDPKAEHVIEVSAPQYKPITRRIAPGELKKTYTFVLEADPEARPE